MENDNATKLVSRRIILVLISLISFGVFFSCTSRVHSNIPQLAPIENLGTESPIIISIITPDPTPIITPSPTPSPEPTGRALRAWQLQQTQRAYFQAHPPTDGDIDSKLSTLAIDPDKKLIALTFDDGPSNMYTNRILDVLEKYNARATFFIVGKRIENHTEVIARAISLNCEIGNHTWAHSDFTNYSKSVLISSLKKVDDAVQTEFGYSMRLFRPPYAAINEDVEAASVQMQYTMALWSGSSHDWSIKNVDKIYKNCFNCAADGAIVLFHDVYSFTADAIELIVPDLIEQGYQLVTVSELIAMDETTVVPGDRYGGWADSVKVEY